MSDNTTKEGHKFLVMLRSYLVILCGYVTTRKKNAFCLNHIEECKFCLILN
jgi:hypothetical protein